ncbi:MAG TPA: RIP metalloprotease RseP [Thermomicrobiaceae bacterium]|nr:RIP metalloprotease RseP [Thermomicrobiaceae bacterium]
MTALLIIPILAILILVHELGHFVTARLVGIKVEEFGIGIPPRLWGFKRNGIIYSINLIPLGGFVRVLGEDGHSFEPGSMQSKSRLQRTAFIVAGSFMNVVLAFALMIAVVGIQGQAPTNVYVAQIQPNSPAQHVGWQPGDRFVSVAGQPVTSVNQIISETEKYAGKPMPVVLLRHGQTITSSVVPRVSPPPGSGRVGMLIQGAPAATLTVQSVKAGSPAAAAGVRVGDTLQSLDGQPLADASAYSLTLQGLTGKTVPLVVRRDGRLLTVQLAVPTVTPAQGDVTTGVTIRPDVQYQRLPLSQIVPQGVGQTVDTLQQMVQGLAAMVHSGVGLSGITGPIGMGQLTSEVLAASAAPAWVTLANLMVLLSLNLAILNLLPFPALDGGRLLFVVVEFIRGKRVSPEKEGLVHFVGLVILLGFMFVVAFVDINRIMSGQSLLH